MTALLRNSEPMADLAELTAERHSADAAAELLEEVLSTIQRVDQVLCFTDQDHVTSSGICLRAVLDGVNVRSTFLVTALHALDGQNVSVDVFRLQGRELTDAEAGHE